MVNKIVPFQSLPFNSSIDYNEKGSEICKLSTDLFPQFLKYVELKEIGACAQTCKRFYQESQNEIVWKHLLNVHLPEKKLQKAESYRLAYKQSYLFYRNLRNKAYTSYSLDYDDPTRGVTSSSPILLIHPEEGKLFSTYVDKEGKCTVKVWNLQTNQCIDTLQAPQEKLALSSPGYSLVFSHNKLFKSCIGIIQVWDINSHQHLVTLKIVDDGAINHLAVYRDILISSSSIEDTIKIWNTNPYEQIATLKAPLPAVASLNIYEDKLICSTNSFMNQGGIVIWDLNSLEKQDTKPIFTMPSMADSAHTIIHQDNLFLRPKAKPVIEVWDLKSYQRVYTLKTEFHGGRLYAYDHMLFSEDGTNLSVWDLTSYQCIASLKIPDFSRFVVYGGKLFFSLCNNEIKVWDFTA